MKGFIEDLKRRNVIKAAIAYIVVGWVLLQVASLMLPIINAPDWVLKTFTFFLVLGFPIWIVFSWVYDVTPEGLKKTADNPDSKETHALTNKRLNILILVGLVAAIVVALLGPANGINFASEDAEYAIAVLPFDDMSAQKDTEWFCDGVTEDILTNLSGIQGLKVISRTSTERYKDTDKSVPEIAAELGVSYIVEGSVRKQDDNVLITAQLISAEDQHIWAKNYNEKLTDVFKIQGDVSRKIVSELKIKISPREAEELTVYPTDNVEAYQAYLKARGIIESFTPDGADLAKGLLETAIELDPEYSDAYAELGFLGFITRGDSINVFDNLEKALELNPNSARAYSYMGITTNYVRQQPEQALVYLNKALELNPNDAKVHDMLAAYHMDLLQQKLDNFEVNLEKALYHADKSAELDPLSPQSAMLKTSSLVRSGRFEDAISFYKEKKALLDENARSVVLNSIVNEKRRHVYESGEPVTNELEILNEALNAYPLIEDRMYWLLATYNDAVLNNDEGYLSYAKKAWELDAKTETYALEYHSALVENQKFDEAKALRASKRYKSIVSIENELDDRHYYYYAKGDYPKALEVLNDSLIGDYQDYINLRKAVTYAQMNERVLVDSMLRSNQWAPTRKALVFAILKERDSMYYYLEKCTASQFRFPNSRHEYDPYRQEARYLELLEKFKFPAEEQGK